MRTKFWWAWPWRWRRLLTAERCPRRRRPRRRGRAWASRTSSTGRSNTGRGGQYDIWQGHGRPGRRGRSCRQDFRVIERKEPGHDPRRAGLRSQRTGLTERAKKSKIGKSRASTTCDRLDHQVLDGAEGRRPRRQGVCGLADRRGQKGEVNLTATPGRYLHGRSHRLGDGQGSSSKLTGANFGKGGTSLDMGSASSVTAPWAMPRRRRVGGGQGADRQLGGSRSRRGTGVADHTTCHRDGATPPSPRVVSGSSCPRHFSRSPTSSDPADGPGPVLVLSWSGEPMAGP